MRFLSRRAVFVACTEKQGVDYVSSHLLKRYLRFLSRWCEFCRLHRCSILSSDDFSYFIITEGF
jgi:hypothetical protein